MEPPPSALIIRSRCYARFDPSLVWRVDVEAYIRSRQAAQSVQAWPGPGVVSYVDRQGSITATLRPRLAATLQRESAWLNETAGRRPAAGFWLAPTLPAALLRRVEPLAWAVWRGGQRLWPLARGRLK